MIARRNLPAGMIVEKFDGPIVSYDDIPDEEICYALLIDDINWMIPKTNARYINHSCCPNCIINDRLDVQTIRLIKKGEEISICYNIVRPWENPGPWDSRWSFNCECGAKNCQGIIDRYIYLENDILLPDLSIKKIVYDISHT